MVRKTFSKNIGVLLNSKIIHFLSQSSNTRGRFV